MKTKSLILGFAGLMALSSCQKDEINLENESSIPSNEFCGQLDLIDSTLTADGLRAAYAKNYLWTNGQYIPVKITNGTTANKKLVIEAMFEWMAYANITFIVVPDNYTGSCLTISFQNGTSSSEMGGSTHGLGNRATSIRFIGFESTKFTKNQKYGTILHEFGHVLGMVHEHQSPNSTIQWNTNAVFNYYRNLALYKDQNDDQLWQTILTNVIGKYSTSDVTATSYDENSLMMYTFPSSWTTNGKSGHSNYALSALDKSKTRQMYPLNGTRRLYRGYIPTGDVQFCTSHFEEEIKSQNFGQYIAASLGKVHENQVSGTTKLHRYWNGKDHYYTTNYNFLGAGKGGYTHVGFEGYVYSTAKNGTIPVYQYYNSKTATHVYTTDLNELGNGKLGYAYEGIAFYILPN
ncbi:MAG: hypothetical protein IK005_05715 [Paludibacteraceae bacterium]|nr:hypothetical protein [Paludibacteraceae bacterium]